MAEQRYPKWKYHADCEPLLIKSEAQERAIGPIWAESPGEAEAAKAAALAAQDASRAPKRTTKQALGGQA